MSREVRNILEVILLAVVAVATVFSCYVSVLALGRSEVRDALNPFAASSTPEVREVPVTVVVVQEITIPPPISTPYPTLTPWPTSLPEIVNVEITREIEVTREIPVTVIIERILTSSPYPTLTPWPTYTLFPTITPTFNPSSGLDTPPGSILEVGQTWRQNDAALAITHFELMPGGESSAYTANLAIFFEFENLSNADIVFSFSPNTFVASDNLNRRFDTGHIGYSGCNGCICVDWNDNFAVTSHSGQIAEICRDNRLVFAGNITDNAVTEVIITVKEFSRIRDARWRIPIPH